MRHALACICVLLGLAGVGCGGEDSAGKDDGDDTLTAGSTYRIGYARDKTGPLAFIDEPTARGIQVAADRLNREGGIAGKVKIELDVRDGKGDPAQTATVTQELIDDGAELIIGSSDADVSLPAAQVAARAKVPFIPGVAGATDFPDKVPDGFGFLFNPGTHSQGAAMAEYAHDQGYRSAFLHSSPDSDYTSSITAAFRARFEELGGRIAGESEFSIGDRTYRATATEIEHTSPAPDVVVTTAYLPDIAAFLKDLERAQVRTPVLIDDGNDTTSIFELGTALRNVTMFTNGGESAGDDEWTKFVRLYTKAYGKAPEALQYESGGYDMVLAIAAAIEEAGSTDGSAVRDALAELEDAPGAQGPSTYLNSGNVLKKAWVPVRYDLDRKDYILGEPFHPQSVPELGS